VATLVGQVVGWRGAMASIAGAALLLAVAVRTLLPPLPAPPRHREAGVLPTLRAPGVAALFGVTAVAVAGHFVLFTYIEPFARGLGLAGSAFSAVLAGYGVSAVLGSLSAEWLGGPWPLPTALAAAGLFTLTTAGIWLAGATGSARLGVPLIVLWSGTFALTFLTAWLCLLRRVPPAAAETTGALHNIVFQGGIVSGSALASLLAGSGGIAVLPLVAAGAGLVVVTGTVLARGAWSTD
jgi:predicted MFS family arabinose efflux permease